MSPDEKKKPDSNDPPEQKLGDTPVPPWEMPTPEEKEQAKPVRRALKKAIDEVDSPQKADEVIEELESGTAGKKAGEVEATQVQKGETVAETADEVEKAEQQAPKGEKAAQVLEETARAVATPDARQREVIAEAAQEVFAPEQQGAEPEPESDRKRGFLQEAVLRRLKPLDALDARLFLAVNHLPHTRLLNAFFYGLTVIFNGGAAWFAVMLIAVLRRKARFWDMFRDAAIPLTIGTALVEFPIKSYFRRRRPFITIIQAIVIGKKPGTWSFPSGHSAAAFGGAWLLNRILPRFGPVRYIVAGLVGFSRIYLGDHYPGDVASGSLLGILFAMFFRRVARFGKR